MTATLPYSTVAGYVTRGETFAQLYDYLRQAIDCTQRMSTEQYTVADYSKFMYCLIMCEEAANVLGHLYNTEDDPNSKLLAHGWLGVGEMFHNNRETCRRVALSPHVNKWKKIREGLEKVAFHIKKMHEEKMQ